MKTAFYHFTKRLIDIIASLIAVILLLPLMIIIAIWIKLDSKGPAVFKQTRAGRNAQPFTLYKFRTMRTDADPFGSSPHDSADPRLTRSGKFLREHSLDELPQLFNVLTGKMSLVGPRPLYIQQITEWSDYHKKRLEVKPGLTGLAQIKGRGELTIEQKLDYDVQYVQTASTATDLKIIFATIAVLLGRKSIYEKQYSSEKKFRDSD